VETGFPKRSRLTKDPLFQDLTAPPVLAISAEEFEHEFAPTDYR
jgi:hypothetical protein